MLINTALPQQLPLARTFTQRAERTTPTPAFDLRLLNLKLRDAWSLSQPMTLENALATMDGHLQELDNADGVRDDTFNSASMQALVDSPDTPPALKRALRFMLATPAALDLLDGPGSRRASSNAIMSPVELGGTGPYTGEHLKELLAVERAAPDNLVSAEQAARSLRAGFSEIDTDGDGQLTRVELQAVLDDPEASPKRKAAALSVLRNGNHMAMLDFMDANGSISRLEAEDLCYAPNQPSSNSWGVSDEAALDRALAGDLPDDLITAFDQGSRANCVSVAVIKAAIDRFGSDVFQEVEKLPEGGYRVTMRDGYELTLTPDDMRMAAQASDFETEHGGDPEALALATLCFAAMARRQDEQSLMDETLSESFYQLNDGARTPTGFSLLGLQDYVRMIPADQAAGQRGVVGDGPDHSAFIDGDTVDLWGEPYPLAELPRAGDDFQWAPFAFFALSETPRPAPNSYPPG